VHASVCDTLTDLVQNAIESGAARIETDVHTGPDRIELRVKDNGKGMDKTALRRAVDPFFSEKGKHDRRRVGLGLPLLYQTAEAANGSVEVRSVPGQGTEVRFTLDARHVDAPPLGDLPATLVGLMAFEGTYELVLKRTTDTGSYAVSRSELRDALGDLREPACLTLAKRFFEANEASLTNGR